MVDVVVVGGGPAGCSAALTLRAAGLSVTVVAAPRVRAKPTETSLPQLRSLLRALGAEEALSACEPCYGIQSNWGQSTPLLNPSITNPHGHAWFVHRAPFDATLKRLAMTAGSVWLEVEAKEVKFGADLVTVGTNHGDVTAQSVLLATGSLAWTARVTGQKLDVLDSLICYWARLHVPLASRLLHVETTADGWWYVCPGEGQTLDVCFVTDAPRARTIAPGNTRNWNAEFQKTCLSRALRIQTPAEEIRVMPFAIASLPQRCGNLWAAAGDAAIKLDPIASSGTATALNSGACAARVLLENWGGNTQAGNGYDRWGAGLLDAFVSQRKQHYATQALQYPSGFWSKR